MKLNPYTCHLLTVPTRQLRKSDQRSVWQAHYRTTLKSEDIIKNYCGHRRCVNVLHMYKVARVRQITLEQALARNTTPDHSTGCHVWTGTTSTMSGLPRLPNGNSVRRAVWQHKHGDTPHTSCDNPQCVNIEHMELNK